MNARNALVSGDDHDGHARVLYPDRVGCFVPCLALEDFGRVHSYEICHDGGAQHYGRVNMGNDVGLFRRVVLWIVQVNENASGVMIYTDDHDVRERAIDVGVHAMANDSVTDDVKIDKVISKSDDDGRRVNDVENATLILISNAICALCSNLEPC